MTIHLAWNPVRFQGVNVKHADETAIEVDLENNGPDLFPTMCIYENVNFIV